MKKRIRLVFGLLLVIVTFAVFAWYISGHMNLVWELKNAPPIIVIWLIVLYGAWLGAIIVIMQASLFMCRRSIPVEENIVLNAYSTLANFFVPGQGGIAVRGVYLKKKHNLPVRDYVTTMLLYYACYALVSAFMLLAPNRPWWQTVAGLLTAGLAVVVGVRWYMRRLHAEKERLNIHLLSITYLLGATVVQAVIQVCIYAVELHSVNHSISIGQIITYTGAANFALFVALTPGAIGIRESFLVFSQGLHHISTANIVSASIIDRAIFLLFLGLLFVFTLMLHAKNRFQIEKPLVQKGNLED